MLESFFWRRRMPDGEIRAWELFKDEYEVSGDMILEIFEN